jgi:predicted transcriptional regulator
MESIYDRLNKRLKVDKREGGISPLEIAELPPPLRRVMRLMLRENSLTVAQMAEVVCVDNQMTRPELEQALDELTRQSWLLRNGSGESAQYEVNLRRRTSAMTGIWATLNERIQEQNPSAADDQEQKT